MKTPVVALANHKVVELEAANQAAAVVQDLGVITKVVVNYLINHKIHQAVRLCMLKLFTLTIKSLTANLQIRN
jgi:hypothetical protein